MGPMYLCLHLYPLLALSLKIQTCRSMNYIKKGEKEKGISEISVKEAILQVSSICAHIEKCKPGHL